MEKRSVSSTIITIILLLVGLIGIFLSMSMSIIAPLFNEKMQVDSIDKVSMFIGMLGLPILFSFYFVWSLGLFFSKNWARKGLVFTSSLIIPMVILIYVWSIADGDKIDSITNYVSAFVSLFSLSILYYFTRPKVKEQFK